MKFIFLFIIPIFTFGLLSCSDDEATPAATTYSYAGPGSNWTASFSGNAFTINETDSGMEVLGTFENLASGFRLLTVSSATGPDAPTAGAQAYGLDIPGVVFLLKPLEANSEIIPMVAAGSCPTSSSSMNWIVTKMHSGADASSGTQDALGTATFSNSTGILPFQYSLTGATVGTNIDLGAFTCANGKATVSDAEMYLTAAGGAIVRTGYSTANDDTDDGIILAMPAQSVASGDADGEYVGLVFTSGDTATVGATVTGTSIAVTQVDPDTGTAAGSISDTMNITAFDSPNTGFIAGELASNTAQKVNCTVNTNVVSSGKSIIFCSGMDGDGAGGAPDGLFAVLLISK